MTAAALHPPAGRQGPGTIVEGLLDAIDLLVVRLVARGLPGEWRAVGVGRGTELAQLRAYEPGDDVRHLDAAATARTGQPHVRLHVPERALTTWILLDLSPSMAFGTAHRLKADVAEGVSLVLARLAIKRAGSVGMVAFGAGAPIVLDPRGSRARDRRRPQPPCAPASAATDGRIPRRSRPRWSACWRSRNDPASWRSSRTFATSSSGPSRSPRSPAATASSRSRSTTLARRRCPPSAGSPSSIPRAAGGSRWTRLRRACERGLRNSSASGESGSASELAALARHSRRP